MWQFLLCAVLLLLIVLYNISTTIRYYLRISFFYLCILLHGMECTIFMIPSYLRGEGADLIFHWFRYWCLWTGVTVDVRGFDENLSELNTPAVVIANHQSAIDVISMTHVWPPRGIVMMKKSLMYIPFFNLTSYLGNSYFVDRFNKDKAWATVDACIEKLKTNNLKVWVFPEGTRNKGEGMLPFKKGAFNIAVRAQIPIVPIVLSNYSPFYSKTGRYFHSDGEVIAKVLPPVSTQGLSEEDVPELTEKIRNQMLEVYEVISREAKEKMHLKRTKKIV